MNGIIHEPHKQQIVLENLHCSEVEATFFINIQNATKEAQVSSVAPVNIRDIFMMTGGGGGDGCDDKQIFP